MRLVTGGDGQLGTAICSLWPDAVAPSIEEMDLTKPDLVYPRLEQWSPDLIMNCAAYTDVDGAEENEAVATAINGYSVGEMARYASDRQIPFVTFSTDYVFAGDSARAYVESDPTDPINAYGRSKEYGERKALEYDTSLIIRTSWLVSGTHPNFVATMLRLISQMEISVVNDQHGCPTIASDLAVGAIRCLEIGMTGVVHLASPPATTWFHLAREVATLAGMDPLRVSPCTTAEYPLPARRPSYSVLESERLANDESLGLPSWRLGLPVVVEQQLSRGV